MERGSFGNTELKVTPLGLGTAEIGISDVSDECASEVLHGVLDLGVNVIDTAACYGDSEEKIGRAIADRRDEYVLITKCGHKLDDLSGEAWSGDLVRASVERSLRRLQTDHLDVVLLHSCSAEELDNPEMLDALQSCKASGKTRYIGYSGDGDDADKAVGMDLFDALECSLNIVDQQAMDRYLPAAERKGLGVILKRPVANGAWRDISHFTGFYREYVEPYRQRLEAMDLTPEKVGFDGHWIELALRYSANAVGGSTSIVGSTNLGHLKDDVEIIAKGPLPESVKQALGDLWRDHDDGSWSGRT